MIDFDHTAFCGSKDWNRKPFSHGAASYATDRNILVRVSRRPDITESAPDAKGGPTAEQIAKTLNDARDRAGPLWVPQFTNMPPVPETTRKLCWNCDGTGRDHDCPECNCTCSECDGAGELTVVDESSVGIDGVPFQTRYIRLILALPGIALPHHPQPDQPMYFMFSGGDGAVMPLLSPDEQQTQKFRARSDRSQSSGGHVELAPAP